jgi:hypothetical protein
VRLASRVLYITRSNPYGVSWGRRTTHENVDLNRNFHDFSQPLPRNPATTSSRRARAADLAAVAEADARSALSREHGAARCRRRSRRPVRPPEGLFYGGRNPTWSHVTLRHVLREHAARCARSAGSTCTPASGRAARRAHLRRPRRRRALAARAPGGASVTSDLRRQLDARRRCTG